MLHRAARRILVPAVALAVAINVTGWLAPASGAAYPRTVVDKRGVPVSALASGPGPGAVTASAERLRTGGVAGQTATRTVCAGIWFTGLGIVWNQTGGGEIHVRLATGPRASRFGRTRVVGSEAAEGPDPGTPESHPGRNGTDFLWAGGGRCVRLALRLPPHTSIDGVTAVFVNSSGSAAGPATGPRNAGPTASPAAPPEMTPAGAMTVRPAMVSRAGWGADPSLLNAGSPDCHAPYYAPAVKMAFVHHTSGSNDYTPDQSDDIVRGIYAYHVLGRGYCDIAYSFLIDRFGTIFVGRAGGVTLPVVPASQEGFNTGTFSVSAMGNFQIGVPPDALVSAIERLLAWRLDVAHLPPNGSAVMTSAGGSTTIYPAGTTVTLPLISGHRQTGITDCPGDHLWALLPQIRTTVTAMGTPKIYRPTASARQIVPGQGTIAFAGTASGPMTWRVDIENMAGDAVRTMFRQGSALDVSWNGLDEDGLPPMPGAYVAVVSGQTVGGGVARPATFPIVVDPQT